MEQDEVYHRAMDAAGSKIKNGKVEVDKDGRPLADAARRQRQAIQSEQVHTYDAVDGPVRDNIRRKVSGSLISRVVWTRRVSPFAHTAFIKSNGGVWRSPLFGVGLVDRKGSGRVVIKGLKHNSVSLPVSCTCEASAGANSSVSGLADFAAFHGDLLGRPLSL